MQPQTPHQIILNYLLDSSARNDVLAQPDSITILKEQRTAQLLTCIVTYTNLHQQQIYAYMSVRQTETGIWEFAGFIMMGGIRKFGCQTSPAIAIFLQHMLDYAVEAMNNFIELNTFPRFQIPL